MSASPATLILLPGLDGTEIFFRPLLAALPPWIRARCVEYPTWGPNDYGDLLPLVRDACRACDDFFLLGWSFSGPLALMMAAESPGTFGAPGDGKDPVNVGGVVSLAGPCVTRMRRELGSFR